MIDNKFGNDSRTFLNTDMSNPYGLAIDFAGKVNLKTEVLHAVVSVCARCGEGILIFRQRNLSIQCLLRFLCLSIRFSVSNSVCSDFCVPALSSLSQSVCSDFVQISLSQY